MNENEPLTSMPERTRQSRGRWWIHLILIGGYFVPVLLLSLGRVREGPALTNSVSGLLFVAAMEVGSFALVFALGCAASRASREELLLRWRPRWLVWPLGFVYSIILRFAVVLITLSVVFGLISAGILKSNSVQEFAGANRPEVEKLVDISALSHDPVYYWLTLTLVSFVVDGLREEMWRAGSLAAMRALWPRAFASRGGEFLGIAIIAIFFGAAHLQMGVLASCFAGLLGLFLGAIMLVHRSIWPAVIAHGFFDAATMALLPYLAASIRHVP